MRTKIRHTVRFLWFNIGIALLVLILMEGGARGYLALRERARVSAQLVEREEAYDASADEGWVPEYLREIDAGREGEWHPYVYWRRRPFHAKYLNIDQAGIRKTWNSTSSPAPGQLKVWMFGGSTLWGVGSRDDFTIPSLVSKKLAANLHSGVWVTSFAEIGYVSTQEVITLMLELRKGNVPDVVVFLDGVNDAIAAYQSGVAGIPQNESNRVVEFDALKRLTWRETVVEKLALYKLIAGTARTHGIIPSARFVSDDGTLAGQVVDVYLWNAKFVDMMAQRLGFRTVYFWQPTVFTKKQLSREERQWVEQPGRKFWVNGQPGPVLDKVYGAFRKKTAGINNIRDLSDVFDDVNGTIFIDEWHITEAGNERIAEVMTPALLRQVARK